MIKKSDIEYFLGIANAVSVRSKDPSTKVGCIIVRKDLTPVSVGYNGFVKGCDENVLTYERPMKYKLILHAEENAVLFARDEIKDAVAFVTHAPCSHCLLLLLQKGIKVVYFEHLGPIARYGKEEIQAIRLILKSNPKAQVFDKNAVNICLILDDLESQQNVA